MGEDDPAFSRLLLYQGRYCVAGCCLTFLSKTPQKPAMYMPTANCMVFPTNLTSTTACQKHQKSSEHHSS